MSYRKKHIHPRIKGLKKRKRFFKKPLFWIFLASLLIIFGVVYFLLFSSVFEVTTVNVSGNENIEAVDIQSVVWSTLPKKIIDVWVAGINSKSIFMVNEKNIADGIALQFPTIETVQVEKILPHTVALHIKERRSFAMVCEDQANENCFLMDERGVAFELVLNTQKNMMTVQRFPGGAKIVLGQQVIPDTIMAAISKIQKNLKDNFQVSVSEVLVSDTLICTMPAGWKVYFDPTQDIDLQIMKMNAILHDQITKNNLRNLEYIYLQYKDKAYYK